MPKPLLPSEQLAHSTTRIECRASDGSVSTGTGFFYRMLPTAQNHVPVIVTNKHVVANAVQGRFWLTVKDAEGAPIVGKHVTVEVDNFEALWVPHPDPNVDLCAMPIGSILNQTAAAGTAFFYITLDESILPRAEDLADLSAMEEIVMVGYPNGIWDSTNNMPIIRKGVTATHPNVDYEGRAEFLIDAACFPGSSGSPVLLFNTNGWITRDGKVVMGGTRVKLLGILYAGPQHTAAGEIVVVSIPTQHKPVALTSIPINLGLVIKASKLRELEAEVAKRKTNAA